MKTALLALVLLSLAWLQPLRHQASAQIASGVAILQVDTDCRSGTIDPKIYGQFLEHINHSVVDGLFAEQIRGGGFEGRDFETYWTPFGSPDAVRIVEARFEHGTKSLRFTAGHQPSGIRQGRVFLECGRSHAGSVWVKIESGAPRLSQRVLAADGHVLADLPLQTRRSAWQEVPFLFASARAEGPADSATREIGETTRSL
jgi:alpha-L-arabinofuranosidase